MFDEIDAAAAARDVERATRAILALPPIRTSASIPVVRARWEQMSGRTTGTYVEDTEYRSLDPPTFERLDQIHAAVLLVNGDQDYEGFKEEGRILVQRVPDAELHIITGAGHVANIERAEEFNRAVLEFLRPGS